MASMTPVVAIEAMTDWFAEQRVEGVVPGNGDMLLFQWGTYGWSGKSSFEFEVVRQFIVDDEEDDAAFWQLHLTLYFPPDETLGPEEHWCYGVEDVAEFRAAILANATVERMAGSHPERVRLYMEEAG